MKTTLLQLGVLILLFTANSSTAQYWDEFIKVTASDATANDEFGYNVDIHEDRAIVASYKNGHAGPHSGAVYIFELVDGVWGEMAKLTASDAAAGDEFGRGVSIEGDRAAVGAFYDDDAGFGSGSAYVFEYSGGVWSETAKITASDAAGADIFGYSLALDGDRLAVGAYGDNDLGTNAGSAYVFDYSGGVWTEADKLLPSDGGAHDYFASTIDLDGDIIVVGGLYNDSEGTNAGSAYVFENSGGIWSETAKLVASDIGANDYFGISCAIDGERIIVGSYFGDAGAVVSSGAAYIFEFTGVVWAETAKLVATDASANNYFGAIVAIDGDRVAITSYGDDEAGAESGSVYVFEFDGAVWTEISKHTASDASAGDGFGYSLAIDGEMLVVGAALVDGIGVNSGAAYFLDLCHPLTIAPFDAMFCEGDLLTLDATSGSGAEITWDGGVVNGVEFDPEIIGAITYTAISDDPYDCPLPIQIEIFANPILMPTIGGESYCDGDTIVLGVGGDADTYEWTPLDFTPPIGVTTYTVTGTYDESGCSTSESIDVTMHAIPDVTASVDYDEICIGNSIIFSATGAMDYTWDPLEVVGGEAYFPETAGTFTYTVVGTDENGCSDEDAISVIVADEIEITYVVTEEMIFEDGEIDITVTGGVAPYSFDWDIDGTGDFDDDEDLTGLADALYIVNVLGSTGCSAEAWIVLGTQAGIGEGEKASLSVYPNPASDFIMLQTSGQFNYSFYTVSGALILNGAALDQVSLSLKDVPAGVYFIVVDNGDVLETVKVVKE
ncbi:MAG: T9SS type A sorting domain-containing protein [Crocinitomix sp.]|nr:T9SS type A sorting domain-containing protein [Crocinitomix sp.]